MKKIMLFAAVLLVAAGCARELEITDIQDETPVDVIEETPQVTVIHARFENPETKTYIEMNQAGTSARVLWNSGDAIMVYGFDQDGSGDGRKFTTYEEGVSSVDFSNTGSWDVTPYNQFYAFYPFDAIYFQLLTESDFSVFTTLPTVQTAVPGGVNPAYLFSYASTTSLSDDFVFRNIPSLIKFSLSGTALSDIKSVKFTANGTLAGSSAIKISGDEPEFDFTYYWTGSESGSSSVTLKAPSGGFTTNVDYYIAVYPCETEGFSMAFFNEDKNYIIKSSTKTVDLGRSQITDFGTIDVGNSFGDPVVTPYMTKTGDAKPVDIVVIPDGFTSEEKSDFERLAKSGIDFMFNTAPYNKYKDYFNVYFIWAPSKESGASVTDGAGNVTTARNTAFGSRWGAASYDDMEADEDKVYGFVSAHCPEILKGELDINEVPILIIINDDRYGGIAHTKSSGKTYCQVPYVDSGDPQYWSFKPFMADTDEVITENLNSHIMNTDNSVYFDIYGNGNYSHAGTWLNVLLHEFGGHSFGRLGDEYWNVGDEISYPTAQSDIAQHSYPVPFALNVSGYYNTLPDMWASLMSKKADLVVQNSLYGRIGKYQGADTYIFNRWRSEMISCMYDNRQYFSTLQRALIAKRISDLAEVQFDLDTFLQTIDDPRDPLRDGSLSASNNVNVRGPIMVRPMLPPPVIIDDTPVEIQLMDE